MNLAVLLYQHTDNPKGIPDVWPAEVIELGSGTSLPDSNWILMTSLEYADYLTLYRALFDAWLSANPPQSGTIVEEKIKVGHTISCGCTMPVGTGRYLEVSNNPTSVIPYIVTEKTSATSMAIYNGDGNTSGEVTLYVNESVGATVALVNSTQNVVNFSIDLEVGNRLSWKVTSGSFNKVNVYTLIQSNISV